MNPADLAKAVAIMGVCLGAAGCAEVAPWQRGALAKPHMALDPYPMQSTAQAHIYSSREAAAGGGAGEGGGCGCY